ncbi:MAG: hypothetical protein BWY09_02370 [Candidatus Hydrogenedentes bacterium ADurb.Bin179]|nr:MAG: hypothetical protein BWY09_02370 [Candidatus Hydrogenedentes bacterium ADurb.Bin179]
MRYPQGGRAGVPGHGDGAVRGDGGQQGGWAIEAAELIQGQSPPLLFPEGVQEALARIGARLFHHNIHNSPIRIAITSGIEAGGFKAPFLIIALQCMGGIETGVAPGAVQSRCLQGGLIVFQRTGRRNGARKFRGTAGIHLDAEVQILVGDERRFEGIKGALRPGIDRRGQAVPVRRVIIGVTRHVAAAVLVLENAVRVILFRPLVQFPVKGRADMTFIAQGIGGEGHVSAIMAVQLLQVAHGVEFKGLSGDVVIVGQFGLDENADFIGGFKILGDFTMGVEAHIIEARLLCSQQVL